MLREGGGGRGREGGRDGERKGREGGREGRKEGERKGREKGERGRGTKGIVNIVCLEEHFNI